MDDFFVQLAHIGRRMGKTTAICKAAKEIDATVLVRTAREAERVNAEFGVKARAYQAGLFGKQGPFLVDTDVVSIYAMQKADQIETLQKKLNKAKRIIELAANIGTSWQNGDKYYEVTDEDVGKAAREFLKE